MLKKFNFTFSFHNRFRYIYKSFGDFPLGLFYKSFGTFPLGLFYEYIKLMVATAHKNAGSTGQLATWTEADNDFGPAARGPRVARKLTAGGPIPLSISPVGGGGGGCGSNCGLAG